MAVPNRVYCSSTSGNKLFVNDLEVFRTDGTIKYELLKKGLLVNGQLQVLPKVIENTQVSSGGGNLIKVDWGGGDIDILTGQTWTPSETLIGGWFELTKYRTFFSDCSYRAGRFLLRISGGGSWVNVNGINISFTGFPDFPPIDWDGDFSGADQNPNNSYTVGTGRNNGSCSGQTLANRWTRRNGSNLRLPEGMVPGQFQNFEYVTNFRRTITTNTGDSSTRNAKTPTVTVFSANSCILTVTFEDNTTQVFEYNEDCPSIGTCNTSILINETEEINLSRCISPDSVQITCGKNCPEGTCLKVRCGNTVCCYGNSGEVIKSIFDPEREIKEDC